MSHLFLLVQDMCSLSVTLEVVSYCRIIPFLKEPVIQPIAVSYC